MRLWITTALFILLSATDSWAQLHAAVLPSSRHVQVGEPGTAYATIINGGSTLATGCSIAPATEIPATFSYQTTNPATNQLTGTINTPVDIPAGGSQSFMFGLTPTSPINEDIELTFSCENLPAAPITSGVNTLRLFACAGRPSDVIAIASTPTQDGVVVVPSNGQMAAFSVAAVNIGAERSTFLCNGISPSGSVFFQTSYIVSAESDAPVTLSICQTNASGTCVGPPSGSATATLTPPRTPATFSVFVTTNESIPFDPANVRIKVSVVEWQIAVHIGFPSEARAIGERGSTSVAVRTAP